MKWLAATVLTVALTMIPVPATAAQRLSLPPPTGSDHVGSKDLYLVDKSRQDPWVPAGPRELMVTVFYPALAPIGSRRQYLTTGEASVFLKASGLPDIAPELLAGTRTSARVGAPPVPGRHPLVFLSPGFNKPRATLTGLAEDLAGKGFIAVAVGHNYEAHGTGFPDGRVTECVACGSDPTLLPPVRAADVSFILDRLTAKSSPWSWLVDPARVGMAGHSIGGYSAPATMLADQRIRAGVNIDGGLFSPAPGVDRPFLLLGRESQHTPAGPDRSWPDRWPDFTGWKRWISVAKADHASFTDVVPLAEQLGIGPPDTLAGVRGMALTRAYVGAFFEQHLRGRQQPLLDGPTAANPEVEFWNQDQL